MSAPEAVPWWTRAACTDVDPDLFYPERGESAQPAKMVCARCPVRKPCLADALAMPPGLDEGIRAGLSAKQRRAIRRHHRDGGW